jgi:prepilin-type N-terminal cleavage/methylation domain-containing protein
MKSGSEASRVPVGAVGFTLIELLMVVVIIGIITMFALPRFTGSRELAYRAQTKTDLRTLLSAQEAYFDDYGVYADDANNLNINRTSNVTLSVLEIAGNGYSATATHATSPVECGFYTGPVTPPPGITFPGEGIIACTD